MTLRLAPVGSEPRYIRISLVERLGLWRGRHNVREVRAEPRGQEHVALGKGRLLSWRDLARPEAEQVLEARLRTLEALGYFTIDGPAHTRGAWDWLRDLVDRGLEAATGHTAPTGGAHTAVTDALGDLGLRADEVLDGVATVLGLDSERVRNPTGVDAARVDMERLAVLLPQLVGHADPDLRDVGLRWLALPTVIHGLPPATLEAWLMRDGILAKTLAPHLERKGLALLGPDGLRRVAAQTSSPTVREPASEWAARLGQTAPVAIPPRLA